MKLEDRATLREELSGLRFSKDAKERIIRRLSEEPTEDAAPKHHGRIAFRVALIAAALTLVFAVGGFASGLFNLKDGTTYAELADSSAVIESAVIAVPADNNESEPETAIEIEYRRIYADEKEVMTQESTVNRMLNAVDYYDHASVTFTEQRYLPKDGITYLYTVVNDVELTTGRGYSTVVQSQPQENAINLEFYCNGKIAIELDLNKRQIETLTPRHRMTAEEYDFLVKDEPIHYYGDEGGNVYEGWNNRADWPNAWHSSSCIMPNLFALDLLVDGSCWTLDGESEYLGRTCLDLTVKTVDEYFQEKWGTTHFTLKVDKLTGILLEMKGYDDEEVLRKAVIVSEITIDDPEYTNARIDAGIEHAEALKHEFIYGKSE